MTILVMIVAIVAGSVLSLAGGLALLGLKRRRQAALLLTLPFGAGALLAAAFLDLLPESLEHGTPKAVFIYTLVGFMTFFILERTASWFHHHHEHDNHAKNKIQRRLIVLGDVLHNAIDGLAIGVAFLVSPATGIITTLAVSAHEIPKELGTFALLLSRGWKDKKVVIANLLTAIATLVVAIVTYRLGSISDNLIAPLLGMTAGFFIYVAASDIIPDIHEQPRRIGTIQALMLLFGVVIVGLLISALNI